MSKGAFNEMNLILFHRIDESLGKSISVKKIQRTCKRNNFM